jgi:hypothetical protein
LCRLFDLLVEVTQNHFQKEAKGQKKAANLLHPTLLLLRLSLWQMLWLRGGDDAAVHDNVLLLLLLLQPIIIALKRPAVAFAWQQH